MKLIIAGTRDYTDFDQLLEIMEKVTSWKPFGTPTEIVSGTARGADLLGEDYANLNDLKIKQFPADWDAYGKKAGYLRNKQMSEYADCAICFWDGKSKGTKHMITLMDSASKPCVIVRYDLNPPVLMVNKHYGKQAS